MKSVVKLASVGTYSGPVGSSLAAVTTGLQVWVRHVNANGGVNGHPVALAIVDDGGDPARHRAAIQNQVENERVLAFIGNSAPLTGRSSVEYLEGKRIPVIGSETGSDWFYESPMFFPQTSSGKEVLRISTYSMSGMAKPAGKTKVGIVACSEAQICEEAYKLWSEINGAEGMQVVYRARISLAQPDFTAECVSARNAGVEIFQTISDTNTVQRLATSCARQSYRPLQTGTSSQILDRLKDDPNLDGLLGASGVAPWFQTDTPATRELDEAIRRYGAGKEKGLAAAVGWVAGKLFETAARQLPEPPTTSAIFQGLWAIKNDDLGGLTMPITFTQGQKAPRTVCWWNLTIKTRKWVSPDGFKRHCR